MNEVEQRERIQTIVDRAAMLETQAGEARVKYQALALSTRAIGLREAIAILRGEDPDDALGL